MPNQNNQVDWRQTFRDKCVNQLRMDGNQVIQLTDFIEQTIHQETAKEVDNRILDIHKEIITYGPDILHVYLEECLREPLEGEPLLRRARKHRYLDEFLRLKNLSLQPTNNTKEEKLDIEGLHNFVQGLKDSGLINTKETK